MNIEPIWTHNSSNIRSRFEQDIYKQCQSISNAKSSKIISQDIHLLLHYSSREDEKDGLYLQIATSYLLSQNLQELSSQQEIHIYMTIFLSEHYSKDTYIRLKQWFESIFTPTTRKTEIIPIKTDVSFVWESMINYTKFNRNIQFETILFFLEDDYIFESDMLFDTIRLFNQYNPCFVYHTDNADRCPLNMDDGIVHQIIPESSRTWRSISPSIPTTTYICRLKTFLAFEDLLRNAKTDLKLMEKILHRTDRHEIFYCSIPSYSARFEAILLPNDVNITANEDSAIYFRDWRSMARHAFSEAQKLDTFPCSKIDVKNLFNQ